MSEDSYNNSKDRELFEFYLEHGKRIQRKILKIKK